MLVTNQEYRTTVTLKGLENKGEQFRISSNAVARVRIKSYDGTKAYTDWVTLSHNANKHDDWALSKLDIIIPPAETAKVEGTTAKLDIHITGAYVDKSGADTADTYNESWNVTVNVEQGLA